MSMIPHTGGPCPVHPETRLLVRVKTVAGEVETTLPTRARQLATWEYDPADPPLGAIVAWRDG